MQVFKLINIIFAFKKAIYKLRYGKNFSSNIVGKISCNTSFNINNNGKIRVGKYVETRKNVNLTADGGILVIENGVFINNNCTITACKKIEIGKNSSFGPNVVIVDHDHNYRKKGEGSLISTEVAIGENVWIGANVVILRGTKIGDNSIVGAGTIVKGVFAENSIIYNKNEIIVKSI